MQTKNLNSIDCDSFCQKSSFGSNRKVFVGGIFPASELASRAMRKDEQARSRAAIMPAAAALMVWRNSGAHRRIRRARRNPNQSNRNFAFAFSAPQPAGCVSQFPGSVRRLWIDDFRPTIEGLRPATLN